MTLKTQKKIIKKKNWDIFLRKKGKYFYFQKFSAKIVRFWSKTAGLTRFWQHLARILQFSAYALTIFTEHTAWAAFGEVSVKKCLAHKKKKNSPKTETNGLVVPIKLFFPIPLWRRRLQVWVSSVSMLEIPLDKELTTNCLPETRKKLREADPGCDDIILG